MSFNTIFLGKTFSSRRLYLTAPDSIYQYDGANWTNITGDPVDDGTDARWSGGWLAGAVTMANRKAVRTFRPGIDADSQPMQYDPADGSTWESKNYHAETFRPFREYMLAGNVTQDGAEYPSRIQWCAPVEPGQVPNDWVPLAENRAGARDIADTPGDIIDMHPLRDSMLVYKRDSVHTIQWVGGNSVFSVRRLTTAKGIHARDCIVEYNGRHLCQGIEDIFTVDGNTAHSLIWGRLKRSWLADRDPDRSLNNSVSLDVVNQEVLFWYVSKNAPVGYTYPDKALVLSLRNNSFFIRDYSAEIPHAIYTLDVVNQDSANLVFHAINRTGGQLLDLESASDRLGGSVPFYFVRTGLFSDPGHDWIQVDRAKLQVTGQPVTIKLGDQVAVDATPTWRGNFVVDPATDYKTDARANGNLIAYHVSGNTQTDWQICNLNLLVQKSGSHG